MRIGFGVAILSLAGLSACSDPPRGVGLDTLGTPPPGVSPQSTSTQFELLGLEPMPLYKGTIVGTPTPAEALNFRASDLRVPSANLEVTVESRTYGMRQIELNGTSNYVIAEGDAPVASLATDIRARTGCLVLPGELRSEDASVFTLDCT